MPAEEINEDQSTGSRTRREVFKHLAIITLGLTLLVALLEGVIGWLVGWRLPNQFSDGYFISGFVLVMLGLLSTLKNVNRRSKNDLRFPQSFLSTRSAGRSTRWLTDFEKGYNALVVFSASGALMMGLSILVYKLFA